MALAPNIELFETVSYELLDSGETKIIVVSENAIGDFVTITLPVYEDN